MPLAVKIYQQYGNRTYQVVEENPYRLADDISGIGFKIADEIASRIGIHTDSDYRIRSGLLYVLLQATRRGTYLSSEGESAAQSICTSGRGGRADGDPAHESLYGSEAGHERAEWKSPWSGMDSITIWS